MPSFSSPESSPVAPPFSDRVRRIEGYHAWLILFFAANLAAVILFAMGHVLWALAVFFLPAPWYAWQILRPAARGLGPAITHFRTEQKEVWLTIDDGPHPATTPAMLALLDSHQARATFFLVGRQVQEHPELVSEILRRGHTIGNHTQTHPQNTFWFAGRRKNSIEIDACTAALREVGVTTKYFRPPVGLKNHFLHPELGRRGFDLVLWSARGFDTICSSSEKSLAHIVSRLKPGAIVLVHETPNKLDQQNEFISKLLARFDHEGYRCVVPSDENLIR
ncbi:MAG: polysaccharide deacetylase family protein [Nibricoccus sp.]